MKKNFAIIAIASILIVFIGCSQPSDSKISSEEYSPLKLGKEIAMATKGELGKNLLNAINTKGAAGAVDFCNTQAIPLTDSMAIVKNAKVSRLSDQPRNPNNLAAEPFLTLIKTFKVQLSTNEELHGNTIIHNGKNYQCYPIITNGMCLQCHGSEGTEIAPETLKVIEEKYSHDQATGYKENQLRGIWVIEMD
jgi:nitrate reductase cytochrome c-type subunit